jgi:hypothetical protein
MGGIAMSLLIPGRVFWTLMDETVIIIAGSEALFSVLCVLVNGKGSRGAGSCRQAIGLVSRRYMELVDGLLSSPVGGLPLVV